MDDKNNNVNISDEWDIIVDDEGDIFLKAKN
jgi:hypothetical protein